MLDIVRRSLTRELTTARAQAHAGGRNAHGAGAGTSTDGTTRPGVAIGSGSGAFTTRAAAGAGGTALERVSEADADSHSAAAQVSPADAWYSGGGGDNEWHGGDMDSPALALSLRAENEPYSPPVISRICSASDLTYPNLNLMTTPPAPGMWSPQRPVPGRRGDETGAGAGGGRSTRSPGRLGAAGATAAGTPAGRDRRPPRSPARSATGQRAPA